MMLVEAQLRVLMRVSGSARDRAELLKSAANLMARIERHCPESVTEMHEMIAFFTRRATQFGNHDTAQRDMQIALGLMDRYKTEWLPDKAVRRNSHIPSSGGGRLASYVSQSSERLVAIAPDYRYLATSEANAAFNNTTQVGLLGRHLHDVVGPARFYQRAKTRLDACFSGHPQEYHYALNVKDIGERIIRCQMKPLGGGPPEGRYCSLMYMQDVTDIATGLSRRDRRPNA